MFDQHGVTKLNSFKAETIYRNETAMAFGAAQFAQLQTSAERFPYWQYVTAGDERVRESHRVLDGKIFKVSDSEFFPPLGFNCRCRAIPVSSYKAKRLGITKPDIITPEMKANLQNAEFIGDKVGNFADWLKVKMAELPESTQTIITERLAEIEREMFSAQYSTYVTDSNYNTIAVNEGTGTFVVKHINADKSGLVANISAAKRLQQNGYSVVIQEHILAQYKVNPEFLIIDQHGRIYVSDLKTPDPTTYQSIEGGIKNALRKAVEQQNLTHVVIDIIANESIESIAQGLDKGFLYNEAMMKVIVIKRNKAAEITREMYRMGKITEELTRRLE